MGLISGVMMEVLIQPMVTLLMDIIQELAEVGDKQLMAIPPMDIAMEVMAIILTGRIHRTAVTVMALAIPGSLLLVV